MNERTGTSWTWAFRGTAVIAAIGAFALAPLAGCSGESGTGVLDGSSDATADVTADVKADVSLCGPGTAQCGSACTDLDVDPSNCGACGTTCPTGQFCSSGACSQGCEQGQTACTTDGGAGFCVNAKTDNQNCGACGKACGAGLVCSNGQCATSCASNLATCGTSSGDAGADADASATDAGPSAPYCADTDTDRLDCGGCGKACGDGEICVGGSCTASCASPLVKCGNACVDPNNDPNNCGGCKNTCGNGNATAVCSGGSCSLACNPGYKDCDTTNSNGCEVNTTNDAQNCGACGTVCGTDSPFCALSYCSWLRGQTWTTSSSTTNNGQTVAPVTGSPDSMLFGYADTTSDVYSTQTFSFEALASSSITLNYVWQYSGYHAYFETAAALVAYADGPGGLVSVTLVPNQAVGGGFSFVGQSSLTVTQGYKFGWTASGTNFDSDTRLLGTLTITKK